MAESKSIVCHFEGTSMTPAIRPLMAALLCAFAASAALAGRVEVSFDPQASFTDAGSTPREREQRLTALAEHLKALGQRELGDDRALSIELIDLDLAGTLQFVRHPAGTAIRVLRGGADGPHIELRYSLSDATQVIASGHETLFDAGSARSRLTLGRDDGDPLRQEKQLLDHWFAQRFSHPEAAAR
jgi:hypothetical protein